MDADHNTNKTSCHVKLSYVSIADGDREPRVVAASDVTPEPEPPMAPEPEEEEKREAEAERAEIETARREVGRRRKARLEFMRRMGYPCIVGKGKPPPGWDPRLTLDSRRRPNCIVVDETNYKDVDMYAFLGMPDAPCYCCQQRVLAMQQADLLHEQQHD